MEVYRPQAEEESELEAAPGLIVGSASQDVEPLPLTAAERAAAKKERRERVAKRRPAGFAPWPIDGTTHGWSRVG